MKTMICQKILRHLSLRLPLFAIALCVSGALVAESNEQPLQRAYFAGGCFWCMEADFEKLEGVTEAVSGFTGGTLPEPTYDGDHDGHYETIEVHYDPSKTSYQALLEAYWKNVDPFDAGGQFCDRGDSYRAAIFFSDETQREAAKRSKAALAEVFPGREVLTPVLPVTTFWPVKAYHQDYYKKRSVRYRYFRWRCGRDARLKELWG